MREVLRNCCIEKMNLSFAGCGFLGIYHVGVASCFQEYCPQMLNNKLAGASAGSLVAASLAINLNLAESTSEVLKIAIKARSRTFGPFHPTFDLNQILYDALNKVFPEDAHKKVNGRLFISVTRVSDGKNCLLSEFESKQDLIQALICSCFIPPFSGIFLPKFHGVSYIDGGITNNLVLLDDYSITVSPFAGECDICPQDFEFNYLQFDFHNTNFSLSANNLYRFSRVLFPPHPEILGKICEQGFSDALRFLQSNSRVSALRCLAIESSFQLSETCERVKQKNISSRIILSAEHEDNECDCNPCKRKKLIQCALPAPLAKAIKEAIDSVNEGLINWIFSHRYIEIISILAFPYIFPFEISLFMIIKIWKLLPLIQEEFKRSLINLITFASQFVKNVSKTDNQFSAQYFCELAIREINYAKELKIHPTSNIYVDSSNQKRKLDYNEVQRPAKRMEYKEENKLANSADVKAQRKSNSVLELLTQNSLSNDKSFKERRKSTADLLDRTDSLSERLIQKINFGFTLGLSSEAESRSLLSSTGSLNSCYDEAILTSNEADKVLLALKALDDEKNNSEFNAIEIANKALNIEKEYIGNCGRDELGEATENADTLEKIVELASNKEASIAYYFVDENNQVKIKEIFNYMDEKVEFK